MADHTESPTPAAAGSNREGQAPQPTRTSTPSAAAEPKLFDTINEHSNYVIFHDALMKVMQKIQDGTLAESYNIVDSEDHKSILLNLTGHIEFRDFYTRFPGEKTTYAVANVCRGISFNYDLVEQSHRFYQAGRYRNVEDALQTMDGLSYSAVIQESFEHELAHLKIRKDFLIHHGHARTPEGTPLHKESGFAVNQKIRSDRNGNRQRVAHQGLELQGREEDTVRILEVPTSVAIRGYRAPLKLVWGSFAVVDSELTSRPTNQQLSQTELLEHMKYGGIVDPTKKFSLRVPSPVAQSKKRRYDGDHNGRGGRGGRIDGDRARSPGTTLFQAILFGNTASTGTLKGSVAAVSGAQNEEVTEVDVEEPFYKLYCSIMDKQEWDVFKTMNSATLQAEFVGMDGSCRRYFLPSEPVYVSLTFSNPTTNNVFVKLARKNFARGGIHVEIQGCTIRNRLANRAPMVVKKISPTESHTFLPRKLCDGPKPESKEDEIIQSDNPEMVPYWTPAAGTYMVKFSLWEQQFPLVIRGSHDEDDSAIKR